MEKIFVSACLLGEPVRYHGGDARLDHAVLRRWQTEGRIVTLCPEVAGGLPTPRPAAEVRRDAGGRKVLTAAGADVTAAFERGADAAAAVCAAHGVRLAILKDGSPSCGSGTIYDGTFTGRRVDGDGLTAARLASAGVTVFREDQLEEAVRHLDQLERSSGTDGQRSLEDRGD